MKVSEYNKKIMRQMAAEGAVLLENKGDILPIRAGETVSVFGRVQTCYYKSGTGSGGMVNVEYKTGILDGLRANGVPLNEELASVYADWVTEHPFDNGGSGWAMEPWFQEEMPLDDALVKKAAENSSLALVVIGRTAGEDKDSKVVEGSYLLTEKEVAMIKTVKKHFTRMAVVLNVGNIIDMKWVKELGVDSVIYAWHGGMEGGNGIADVLCGKVSPCGKLSDTIAVDISDYPSTKNYGAKEQNIYQEDIYVGYRYFETFAKDKVLYPFGYGLSYTDFAIKPVKAELSGTAVTLQAEVTNTGHAAGKEIAEVYLSCPQGTLDKPAKVLCAFGKTEVLQPGESQMLDLSFDIKDFASYDETSSSYILDAGTYQIYLGASVADCVCVLTGELAFQTVEQLSQALAPTVAFERLKNDNGKMAYAPVRTRDYDLQKRIEDNLQPELPLTGDKGYKLADVRDGKVSMEEFIAQLSAEDLCHIVKGEGMCSPKVRPGTGGGFGGLTPRLSGFGIPATCVSDGPSGIRMDNGDMAMSIAGGTLIACSWNLPLAEELFVQLGKELADNQIEALLGPGMNIHRNPLNGRNFEYFSEDPYLTGMMAAAQTRGTAKSGTTTTLKHFMGNNQEFARSEVNCIISERAIREIYLKGFEIAVKKGHATAIMTTYGAVNGIWTAGSYDLCTTILRGEWGFDGFVMTDWWAKMNDEGSAPSEKNLRTMVRAQNDIYMVCDDTTARESNLEASLADGSLTLWELQRCAMNLCRYIMQSKAMERVGQIQQQNGGEVVCALHDLAAGMEFEVSVPEDGGYQMTIAYISEQSALAQTPISVQIDGESAATYTINGTGGLSNRQKQPVTLKGGTHTLKIVYNGNFAKVTGLTIEK